MIIQIYAFTKIQEAVQAALMGVDHVGFVAGKYDLVPAELTYRQACELRDALPPETMASALTMSSDPDEILRMAEVVRPNILHISNDFEDVRENAMEYLRKRLDGSVRIMKALPVGDQESVDLAKRFSPFSDIILLDTKVTEMPGIGATGTVHDWNISRQIVETCGTQVILAGGLSGENVAEAIRKVKPWGVDSNTCTNIQGSNVEKDMKRVEAFVRAIREMKDE